MKLLGNRCLIEPIAPPYENDRIVLPETLKPRLPECGIIRQLGTSRRGQPGVTHAGYLLSELEVGQTVRLNMNSGAFALKVDDRPHLIVSTLDILAVVG